MSKVVAWSVALVALFGMDVFLVWLPLPALVVYLFMALWGSFVGYTTMTWILRHA